MPTRAGCRQEESIPEGSVSPGCDGSQKSLEPHTAQRSDCRMGGGRGQGKGRGKQARLNREGGGRHPVDWEEGCEPAKAGAPLSKRKI